MAPDWLSNSLKKMTGISDPGPEFIQKTNAGLAALKRGQLDVAEQNLKAALKEAERFGEQDIRKAAAMNNLASVYREQGKQSEAESLFRQAIGIQQIPPNQILVGLSLFLTFFLMMPVGKQINDTALAPYLSEMQSPCVGEVL